LVSAAEAALDAGEVREAVSLTYAAQGAAVTDDERLAVHALANRVQRALGRERDEVQS
jgi:hypothetical protein